MMRKSIATLMLIAMFIHAASAGCKAATLEDVFGDKQQNYKPLKPGQSIFSDPDCQVEETHCNTTIVCAGGFYKTLDIKLWCHGSQWDVYQTCLPKVANLACQFEEGPAIKCTWMNDIQDINGAKYILQLFGNHVPVSTK
eukprot:1009446_1